MTACPEKLPLLHALADGELDAANAQAVEAHVKACSGCAAELARIEDLRGRLADPSLRHEAPSTLRGRIVAALAADGPPASAPAPHRNIARSWLGGAGFGAIAASLVLLLGVPRLAAPSLEDQLISDHVRSLLADHVTDVATSDRHTVKPWFNGKIDFAPPVPDLAAKGFPLAGGRLDYLGGRVVPALVYRRRFHTINLFVRPANGLELPVAEHRQGYSLIRWSRNGLEYWAISDLDSDDLDNFRRAFEAAS